MQVLSKLFGSTARVKLMRLFLLNPQEFYEKRDICNRAKISSDTALKELRILKNIGLVKKKVFYKENPKGKITKSGTPAKKKLSGWILNPGFVFLSELQDFLIKTLSLSDRDIIKRLRPAIGKLKLVVVAGVFIKNWESRVDILIVADKIKEKQLASILKSMEAEIGREIRYAVFNTEDFKYRLTVCDKLIRDIFDYSHRVILDQLDIQKK